MWRSFLFIFLKEGWLRSECNCKKKFGRENKNKQNNQLAHTETRLLTTNKAGKRLDTRQHEDDSAVLLLQRAPHTEPLKHGHWLLTQSVNPVLDVSVKSPRRKQINGTLLSSPLFSPPLYRIMFSTQPVTGCI